MLTKWVFLRPSTNNPPPGSCTIRVRVRRVGDTATPDPTDFAGPTLLDMSTTGAWVHGTAVAGAAGKAVLAYDASGYVIGSYVIEDNGVDEGYPSSAGYFKMAVPANTEMRTLEARDADNTTFAIQTSSLWRSGVAGSDTDLDAQHDVSLPVTLAYFRAAAEPGAVILSWATESELNNQGFYVLRSQRREEGFALISPLIPGAGTSPMGQSYQYTDRSVLPATWYWYRLQQVDFGGGVALFAPLAVLVPETGSTLESVPRTAGLLAPYPNPFVPGTQLRFTLPAEEVVSVAVYDLQGRLTRVVVQGRVPAGEHRAWWDGRDEHGSTAPPGVYFCRLWCADGFSQAVKLVKLR
ncbi:MAG: FlgD immunoglobulin-like domain containing protein [Candidatus Oleimicrobiaceae bacterium]